MIEVIIKLKSTEGEKFEKEFSFPEDFPMCKANKALEDIVTKYIDKCGLDKKTTETCVVKSKFEW